MTRPSPILSVHLEQDHGPGKGAAWCRTDPSVLAVDQQPCVTTAVEADVTCDLCISHIRTYTRTAAPEQIDWFGDK